MQAEQTMDHPDYREFMTGEPAPWFRQRSTERPDDALDLWAGRYLVLCLFGSAGEPGAQRRLDAALRTHRSSFEDERVAFFGVSVDPADEQSGRLRADPPGIRHFWDMDERVSRLYGALPALPATHDGCAFRARWIVLGPTLQVLAVLNFQPDDSDIPALVELLAGLPPVARFAGVEMHAPVLVLPGVFDAALCRLLIERYEHHGGARSGFMREEGGMTVVAHDPRHKIRRDHVIEDEPLRQHIQRHVVRKVTPAIERAYQFRATRMERYLVGCYDSGEGGHFRPHRDNTTPGTAHRRFALSINLNDEFDGGELVFPEFGLRTYRPPAGTGVIFGCSLLHAVTPVRRGRRYAFLPFLYDESAAALREANRCFLADGVGA
jgi:predicted 2-oxoglutarate/Fe(II)-dependent dioxygenase YbiX